LKKLAAILLLALFLFNLCGYRLWFSYVQFQHDTQLQASFDRNAYNESDLVAIKVPINLPYQVDWKNYERVDGELNYKGKILRYVKQKLVNGEMIFLCLPDHGKVHLQSAKNEFVKYANDVQSNSPSGKSNNNILKNVLSEYDANDPIAVAFTPSVAQPEHLPALPVFISSCFLSCPEQPPEIQG
jgi:hypothetical protein